MYSRQSGCISGASRTLWWIWDQARERSKDPGLSRILWYFTRVYFREHVAIDERSYFFDTYGSCASNSHDAHGKHGPSIPATFILPRLRSCSGIFFTWETALMFLSLFLISWIWPSACMQLIFLFYLKPFSKRLSLPLPPPSVSFSSFMKDNSISFISHKFYLVSPSLTFSLPISLSFTLFLSLSLSFSLCSRWGAHHVARMVARPTMSLAPTQASLT